jgi:hypothetical protein
MPFLLVTGRSRRNAEPASLCRRRRTPPTSGSRRAVLDLQEEREHGGIGLEGELALPRVVAGLRIERVEPNTTVRGLLDECELRVRILVLAGNRVVGISGAS